MASPTSSVAAVHFSTAGVVPLCLRDQAGLVLIWISPTSFSYLVEDLLLLRRHDHVVLRDRDAGLGGVVEAELLERVQDERGGVGPVGGHEVLDHVGHVALLERPVDELVRGRVVLLRERLPARAFDPLVEDDPADSCQTWSPWWRRRYSARSCSLTRARAATAPPPGPSGTRAAWCRASSRPTCRRKGSPRPSRALRRRGRT